MGRVKLNSKLDLNTSAKKTILETGDIVEIIKFMLDLRDGKGDVDDIDHLEIEELDLSANLWKINSELVY